MNHYESYDKVPSNIQQAQVFPQMFPDVEKNRKMKLERCMRFLPHFNDDGGFFVAILRKTKKLTDVNAKNERRMR